LVSELLGSKIRFTILLPFVSCYHSIFFPFVFFISCSLFCIVHQVEKKKKKKKKKGKKKKVILKHRVEKKEVILKQQILSKLIYS
jgi:large-conductance mechanosensitive channel